MSTWVKKQFSDVEHARRAVVTSAMVLGSVGFLIVMGSLFAL